MKVFCIHPADNVGVALQELLPGEQTACGTVREAVCAGHKIALKPIRAGEKVIKYGYSIGKATRDILPGQWVHSHNMTSDLHDEGFSFVPEALPLPQKAEAAFMGYERADGSAGIRNEVWILPTVACVNGLVRQMAAEAQKYKTGAIDGIIAFTHPYGCSQLGADQDYTLQFLRSMLFHPNAAAVLVVGLGCENGNLQVLTEGLGTFDKNRIAFLNCQDHADEMAVAMEMLKELCAYASGFARTPVSAAKLTVGLKCGGSDGFSGLTANPLVGAVSDRLIACGGSTLLTEVPEMFGAEQALFSRCQSRAVFDRSMELIANFKAYYRRYGQPVDENPSPGNKAGGITTLAEKSLGCVQKGGRAPIVDVLAYAQRRQRPGLSLVQAPGNDPVAACALAAAGAQLILFTTGRGTPFGCPVPTIKIASNTALAQKKQNWIDFDAGVLLSGTSREAAADALEGLVLDVASGRVKAKSEGSEKGELAIFKDGVTL